MTAARAGSLDEALADRCLVDNPYPTYARLRTEDPVYWSQSWEQWLVTRFDDVQAVARDPFRFSSSGWEVSYMDGLVPEVRSRIPELARHYGTHVLSNTDPPLHSRLRGLLVRSFTPRVVERLRPEIERLVEELLDTVDRPGAVDMISGFCYPLPATVIARLLGAPENDRGRFERWSADLVSFVGSGRPSVERAIRANTSLVDLRSYLEGLVDQARACPGDDLVSLLANAGAGEDRLDEDELVSTCVTLLFAGHETTANLLGNGLLALLRNPDQLDVFRSEPGLAPKAVEELLRFDSPVQRLRRRATTDVELRGRQIRAGDLVMAFNGAANRDPERFASPDRLDLTRGDSGHVAFGQGIHYCVGAALTRLEGEIAFNAVLRRFPRLRLAPNTTAGWKPNITFRGLEALHVELR